MQRGLDLILKLSDNQRSERQQNDGMGRVPHPELRLKAIMRNNVRNEGPSCVEAEQAGANKVKFKTLNWMINS